MATVQLTLDDKLLERIDREVERLGTTRSDFAQGALERSLGKTVEAELEARQRAGYQRHPVDPDEFGDWSDAQVWPD